MAITNNKELNNKVANLNLRLSTLKDEISALRNELNRFKADVSSDVKVLSTVISEKRK
tara:strand:+ start:149 stop:322 length:174 start_codon:yes stop_codon:yes gene_type:complete